MTVWGKLYPDYKVKGDYKDFNDKLIAYKEYLASHKENYDVSDERSAIVTSLGRRNYGIWFVGSTDDLFDHCDRPVKYALHWDAEAIKWRLPGDINGEIMI